MKIKKMKDGYNIRCNDGEFEALSVLVLTSEGEKSLTANAKSAHTRRIKGGDFLRVDVNKRDT